MADNGEQQRSEQPDYKVYRSKRGLLSRFRSPDLSGLRERAKLGRKDGGKDTGRPTRRRGEPGEERSLGKRILRWVGIFAAGWILLSFLAFAVSAQLQTFKLDDDAKSVLGGNPFLLASPQTILVLGTDARTAGQQGARRRDPPEMLRPAGVGRGAPRRLPPAFRADTLMLIRAGGGNFRKLSIPRDSFAEIPGQGPQKINAAYAFGGAKAQIEAVEDFLGIDIDHVAIIDFTGFEDLIDAVGGVKVDVADKLCADISGGAGGGQGGFTLRLGKGEHTLDGEEALTYARIRKPSECPGPGQRLHLGYNDSTARAQQEVINGIKGRLTDPLRLPYNFIKGPIIGWDAPKAFVSDMGFLRCRSWSSPAAIGGSGDTDVLCQGQNSRLRTRAGGSIEVPESERRRAVKQPSRASRRRGHSACRRRLRLGLCEESEDEPESLRLRLGAGALGARGRFASSRNPRRRPSCPSP